MTNRPFHRAPVREHRNVVLVVAATLATSTALAAPLALTGVPEANPRVANSNAPSVLSPDLLQTTVAEGSVPLENPTGLFKFYGYNGDGPMMPPAGSVQSPGNNVEATKTEPDKNTYLAVSGQHGADPNYSYGTHFLFQGHESGFKDSNAPGGEAGYITRINLDADGPHRVTLMASADSSGKPLPDFDGSTWNPFAQRLLFTAELGANGGVWQATLEYPSTVEDISAMAGLGHAGYEGIQNDSDGNLWIVEDVGGVAGAINKQAKQPNSFVYRFVPGDASNLKAGGKLQALQVMSNAHAGPIEFHAAVPPQTAAEAADLDILSQDMKDLHTYGMQFQAIWVTIHDTATDGFDGFDANAKAKEHHATPFKRPENGVFRPGTHFGEFFFTETGDTNADTQAGEEFGGFGALMKLTQRRPSDDSGTLEPFFVGDVEHTGLDNIAFLTTDLLISVEDAGETLHTQRNALDSMWLFDADANYGGSDVPVRLLAQGRDSSATVDAGLLAISGNGFQNDGDNELTGVHVSDGDSTPKGILGGKDPKPFQKNGTWRIFYTQQHGDNLTWEIIPRRPGTGLD